MKASVFKDEEQLITEAIAVLVKELGWFALYLRFNKTVCLEFVLGER